MKQKAGFILMMSCCLLAYGFAQTLRYPESMPYTRLSAYSKAQTDVFSFTANQAALANTKYSGAGVYAERRFFLAELSHYMLAAVFPLRPGGMGLQVHYGGFANFNEYKIGFAYARNLGSKLDVGIQFNYYGYRIAGYAGSSSVNAEAGMIIHLSEKLNTGVHVFNAVGGKLAARVYTMGIAYDASANLYAGMEIMKEENKPANVNGGIQYQFKEQFFVRVGFMSENGSGYAGAGVSWKNFRVDVSASYHPQLGFSPGLLLIINFKR